MLRWNVCTWEHLLHVDLALLEEVGEPLSVLQLGRLLQAKQEEGEVGAILQRVSQLRHTHQLCNDGPSSKLGQVGLHQGHVQLDLRALIQDIEESLQGMREMALSDKGVTSWAVPYKLKCVFPTLLNKPVLYQACFFRLVRECK